MRTRAWATATCGVVLFGCQLLVDFGGGADGGVATVVDGAVASTSNDAGPADAGLVACPAARAGPDLIRTDGFCIDRTEVSARQYGGFLSADKSGIALPPDCDGHSSYEPVLAAPSPEHPVLVAWCDAYAFCQWAGKRLCGATDGGGALSILASGNDSVRDTRANEWLRACVHGDVRSVFPYGDDYDPDACAPEQLGSPGEPTSYGGLTAVGVHPRCVGGYPGLLDMAGNASEWVNVFYPFSSPMPDGAVDTVNLYSAMGGRECRSVHSAVEATARGHGYGIRCCLTP